MSDQGTQGLVYEDEFKIRSMLCHYSYVHVYIV